MTQKTNKSYADVGNILKGHCHAIWQLCKKLEGVFASIGLQN